MEQLLTELLTYAAPPGVLIALGAYIVRTVMQRLTELEKKLPEMISEDKARQLLRDKLDPLHEDIQELKLKLDKIVDLLIRK